MIKKNTFILLMLGSILPGFAVNAVNPAQTEAQFWLDEIHYLGQGGVPVNYERARGYFTRAAEQTVNPEAQSEAQAGLNEIYKKHVQSIEQEFQRMQNLYLQGKYANARSCAQLVAHQERCPGLKAKAKLLLAKMWLEGKGGWQDCDQAQRLYLEVEKENDDPKIYLIAQYNLMDIYYFKRQYNFVQYYAQLVANQDMYPALKKDALSIYCFLSQ